MSRSGPAGVVSPNPRAILNNELRVNAARLTSYVFQNDALPNDPGERGRMRVNKNDPPQKGWATKTI